METVHILACMCELQNLAVVFSCGKLTASQKRYFYSSGMWFAKFVACETLL